MIVVLWQYCVQQTNSTTVYHTGKILAQQTLLLDGAESGKWFEQQAGPLDFVAFS